MDDSTAVEGLTQMGLTATEARVFLALVKRGTSTAQEISTLADVTRPQVYEAVTALSDRGLVETRQTSPTEYRPVTLDEAKTRLLDSRLQTGRATFEFLADIRQTQDTDTQQEAVWLVSGEEAIPARLATLIDTAQTRILYAIASPSMLNETLETALRTAATQDIQIQIVSSDRDVLAKATDAGFPTARPKPDRVPDTRGARLLLRDESGLLLSVFSATTAPDRQETAFWTTESHFATTIIAMCEEWHPLSL